MAAEADDIARCERFAQATGNRAVQVLLELIVDDGQRHQALLRRMIGRLREEVEVSQPPTAFPVPGEETSPGYSSESVALLRSLIRDEQEGARYLRHLARQQTHLYDGFFTLLLDTLARDNETHVHVLRFLLRRLEAATSGDDAKSLEQVGMAGHAGGNQRSICRRIRAQVSLCRYPRRRSVRIQSRPTWKRNVCSPGLFIGTP